MLEGKWSLLWEIISDRSRPSIALLALLARPDRFSLHLCSSASLLPCSFCQLSSRSFSIAAFGSAIPRREDTGGATILASCHSSPALFLAPSLNPALLP